MLSKALIVGVGGLAGTAVSIILCPALQALGPPVQFAAAAYLGAACSALFIKGPVQAIEREFERQYDVERKRRKGLLSQLVIALFWLILLFALIFTIFVLAAHFASKGYI